MGLYHKTVNFLKGKGFVDNFYMEFQNGVALGLEGVAFNGNVQKYVRLLPLVYACATRNAETVANNEWQFKWDDDDTIAEDEYFRTLLRSPNPDQSEYTFKYLTQLFIELCGEAYWFVQYTDDGLPYSLDIINPSNIRIVKENGRVSHYEYTTVEGKTYLLSKDSVLHFIKPTLDGRAMSPLEPLRLSMKVSYESRLFQSEFFQNNATPAGVIEADRLPNPNEKESMLKTWQENHGRGNRHKINIISGKYKQIGTNMKDLDMSSINTDLMNDVLYVFGVSKTILGLSDNVNRATAEQADENYLKYTIKPKLTLLDDVLNHKFLPLTSKLFNYTVYSQHVDVLAYFMFTKLLNRGEPLLSLNEKRALGGYLPVPNGDWGESTNQLESGDTQ